ncbi:MAG: hypothetical protein ACP5OX_01930 [Minisyncoccia bacterium]
MSLEKIKYFAAGDIGGGPEKGPTKKESIDIHQFQKELERIVKLEKIEKEEIEPSLDNVLKILENEPENIRPKDKNGNPGGIIKLKKNISTILIPDLHGRRGFLFKILNNKDEKGITNLEKLLKGEIQIVCLGDGLHTENPIKSPERWKKAQKEIFEEKKYITPSMEEEMADSFGTMIMIMKLKELAPENFHYLRGNHDDINETYAPFAKYAFESSMTKEFVLEKFGQEFLQKYSKFEEKLPFLAEGNNFLVSHTLPLSYPDIEKIKEKALNYNNNKREKFLEFCWTRDAEVFANFPKENMKDRENNPFYFYGHDKLNGSLRETAAAISKNKLNIIPLGIHRIKDKEITEEYLQIDPSGNLVGRMAGTNETFKFGGFEQPPKEEKTAEEKPEEDKSQIPEKTPEKQPETAIPQELPPEIKEKMPQPQLSISKNPLKEKIPSDKQTEKKYRPTKEKQEWLEHFKEELQKIKDLEKNTELQKRKTYKESMKLLNDWLPFGNLDNFNGIEELMEEMEKYRPKTMVTFNYQKEKLAKKIALEMALQWNKNEKSEDEKTERILQFVDKWLKEKSFYYQMAEGFKNYLLNPPKKYLKQKANVGEKLKEPSKVEIWFAREKSALLKLLGERDKTLAEVSKILALQSISFKTRGLRTITQAIENQNIKNNTLIKIREIEEMTKEVKKASLNEIKNKIQALPILPLKIEKYEKLYGEKPVRTTIEQFEEKISKEDALNLVLKGKEIAGELKKTPEGRKIIEELQNKVKDILHKEKQQTKPEVISKAKDYVDKNLDKNKKNWWSAVGGLAGYSLLLLLVLFILGEIKLGETLTKGSLNLGSKK